MKIAILFSNYMYSYIGRFLDLCAINGVEVDFFKFAHDKISFEVKAKNKYVLHTVWNRKKYLSIQEIEKEIRNIVNVDEYDYFLSDTMALSFKNACNFFHGHSTKYKLEHISKGLIQKFYILGHKDIIKFEAENYTDTKFCIVGSSEMKRDYIQNYNIPEDRIKILYPGKDNVTVADIERKEKTETFVVGSVTCGFLLKGGYNILRAIKILKKDFTPNQLYFKLIHPSYKKQWYLKIYVKLLGIEKYVEFLPFQENINNFYAGLDCLMCASNSEAFGRVVTEGMIYGLPVIAGTNVGASDIISEGVNGYKYVYGDNTVSNIAKSVKKAYEERNNNQSLIKQAQKTANAISWFNFTNNLFKILS